LTKKQKQEFLEVYKKSKATPTGEGDGSHSTKPSDFRALRSRMLLSWLPRMRRSSSLYRARFTLINGCLRCRRRTLLVA
jgi:hypothetical protein